MKAIITQKITEITNSITSNASDIKEKSYIIYDYLKKIPYTIFGSTSNNPDELLKEKALTCYGKSILQSAMLEAAKIDWRYELSMCPSTGIEPTIKSLSDDNPFLLQTYQRFPGLFRGKELLHTTIQAKIDEKWQRMDSTLPDNVCNKIKDLNRKTDCLSMDNVSKIHGCKVVGYSKELPFQIVTAWDSISKIGNWANDKLKILSKK